jgi:hypothetical protein
MALVRHTKYIRFLNDSFLAIGLATFVFIEVILLFIWTKFASPKVAMIYLDDKWDTVSYVCQLSTITSSRTGIIAALYIYNIFLIIVCGLISCLNFHLSSRFSDAAFILANMFDTAFTAVLRIPIRESGSVGYSPDNNYTWNIVIKILTSFSFTLYLIIF